MGKKNKVEEVKDAEAESAPVEEVAENPKNKGKYTAIVDINAQIRAGDNVPEEMVQGWISVGIDIKEKVE